MDQRENDRDRGRDLSADRLARATANPEAEIGPGWRVGCGGFIWGARGDQALRRMLLESEEESAQQYPIIIARWDRVILATEGPPPEGLAEALAQAEEIRSWWPVETVASLPGWSFRRTTGGSIEVSDPQGAITMGSPTGEWGAERGPRGVAESRAVYALAQALLAGGEP